MVLYDVGPSIGALNRVVLLDAGHFATPVAANLFALKALATTGRAIAQWITEWKVVRGLSGQRETVLPLGRPSHLGYVTSSPLAGGVAQGVPADSRWGI